MFAGRGAVEPSLGYAVPDALPSLRGGFSFSISIIHKAGKLSAKCAGNFVLIIKGLQSIFRFAS
jgi:hypothetical protein